MRLVWTLTLSAAVALTAQTSQPTPAKSAKPYTPPKTPWGDPDLQGVWPGNMGVPMQRPVNMGTRKELTDQEFAQRQEQAQRQLAADAESTAASDSRPGIGPPSYWTERGTPTKQTSLIVDPSDGRLPALTADEQKLRQQARDGKGFTGEWRGEASAPDDLNLYYRCITRGLLGSIIPVVYNNGNQIVQSPGYLAITQEQIHETRVIPLDGQPHLDAGVRQWLGDSRGHWEGDTLVVETSNFSGQVSFEGATKDMRLIERWTRVADDRIDYRFTVSDPATWTKPWSAAIPWTKTGLLYEYACHEDNYGLYGILAGARAKEHAAK